MNFLKLWSVFLLLQFWLLLGLSPISAKVVSLDFLAINDFHGALLEDNKNPGLAKIATYFLNAKNKNPQGTILLSAGDMFQGSMPSNLSYGRSVVEVMNYLGFDAMTVGNHEFDWGIDKLKETKETAKFPYVSSNILSKETNKLADFVQPYVILEHQGIKIGIIGAATQETPFTTAPKNVTTLSFPDPVPFINRLASKLRTEGVDIIVVLAHIGARQDKNGVITGEAVDVIKQLQGVDLFFCGHVHSIAKGTINNILLMNDSMSGKAIGHVQVTYDTKKRQIVDKQGEVITAELLKTLPPNAAVGQIINTYSEKVAAIAKVKYGENKTELPHRNTAEFLKEQTATGEWITNLMRQAVQADVAIINRNGIRQSLPAGDVTMEAIYQMLPFDNTLFTAEFTGAELLDMLEYGINQPEDGTIVEFSGVQVAYDAAKPYKHGILSITLANGQPLDVSATYKVVTNDFVAAGGDGFSIFTKGRNITDTGLVLRNVILDSFLKSKVLDFKYDQRLKIISQNHLINIAA